MAELQAGAAESLEYQIPFPVHGAWTHESPIGNPPGVAPTLTNCELFGDVLKSALGNAKFITTAWPSGNLTLLTDYRVPGQTPKILLASDSGIVWWWDSSGGGSWKTLRQGLSTTAGLYWTKQAYGTDLFITNQTDGIYRYDGSTLLPIGAVQLVPTDSATDWANATLDTTDFQEGIGSVKVQSANPGASAVMTYTTPVNTINMTTGRGGAKAYVFSVTGDDPIHFKVKFSNGTGSTVDTANTYFRINDTGAGYIEWSADVWRSAKDPAAPIVAVNDNAWHDVWVYAAQATDFSVIFDYTNFDHADFKVTTTANQTYMLIDDVYFTYQTTMPAVKYLAEWRNVLLGANTTANPANLYWSPVNAADEFSLLATAPIKGGGDQITALHSFFHQMTIGTEHHILTLSGSLSGQYYPAYLFDINEVTDEAGISSHRSVVKVNNKLYFFYLGHIMEYNGTGVSKISYGIEPTLRLLDMNKLDYIVGERHWTTNQIWWTVRVSGQSANTQIIKYDFVHQALLLGDLATPAFTMTYSSGEERLLCVDNTNRFVYRQQDTTPGYQQFGTNMAYTIELTPQGMGERALEWQEAFIAYLTQATGNLSVSYRLADHIRALPGTSYVSIATIDQSVAGELGRIRLGFPGKVMQVKLTSTAVPFAIQFPVIIRARQIGDERAFS